MISFLRFNMNALLWSKKMLIRTWWAFLNVQYTEKRVSSKWKIVIIKTDEARNDFWITIHAPKF